MARRYRIFLIVLAATIAADQLTKVWARGGLKGLRELSIMGEWFVLRLACNTGSAFGMFAKLGGARVVLSIVGLAAVAAILVYLKRASDRQTWFSTALGLVAGGALGNVIDRISAGCVTDFVVWRYRTHEWPAFNVADAALVVGVAILFFDAGREAKRAKEEDAEEEAQSKKGGQKSRRRR